MNRKTWMGIGVALAIVGMLFGVHWRIRQQHAPTFRTVRVTRGDLHVTVLATGTIQPQNRLELKPPIAGRTEDILVKEGQSVQKGQILAWMSSTERAALLDAARAKGPEEVAHWEERYKPTPLIAPIDGTVIARNVEPGQSVTASDAVLVLSDRLIVKVQVDETDIGQIQLDQYARITLDAYPGETIEGRVDHIAYEAKTVNNVTIYEVDVLPVRVPPFMRSGMTANVTFLVEHKEGVLVLPSEAVRQDHGQATILVPDRSQRHPRPQEVVTGLTDGKNIELLSGASEGDTALIPTIRSARGSGPPPASPFSPFGRGPRQGGRSN